MKKGIVFETMRRLAERLASEGIPYAIIGGMALAAHGFVSSPTTKMYSAVEKLHTGPATVPVGVN